MKYSQPLTSANGAARKASLFAYMLLLPPLLLALPVGMPNGLSQPLALLLLAPLIFKCLPRALSAPTLLILVFGTILVSILQIALSPDRQHSLYQAVRGFAPFLFLNMLIVAYRDIERFFDRIISSNPDLWSKRFRFVIYAFCFFTTLQTVSYFFGLPLANKLSASSDIRVMIFMTTSCVLLLYYGISTNNYIIIGTMSLVVLGTGSKGIFLAAVGVAGLAMFYRFQLSTFLKGAAACVVLTGIVMVTQPLVVERLVNFIEGGSGANATALGDIRREYEIDQAQKTMTSSGFNLFLGAGFAMQVSDGVPTRDPAWAENSKYDIENGYWGVLSKLGILFTLLTVIQAIIFLPRTHIIFAVLIIESIVFFKTSYQIFCYFDGVMILVWSIILSVAMRHMIHVKSSRKRAGLLGGPDLRTTAGGDGAVS